jgi:hypothetical protein
MNDDYELLTDDYDEEPCRWRIDEFSAEYQDWERNQ